MEEFDGGIEYFKEHNNDPYQLRKIATKFPLTSMKFEFYEEVHEDLPAKIEKTLKNGVIDSMQKIMRQRLYLYIFQQLQYGTYEVYLAPNQFCPEKYRPMAEWIL